MSSSKPLINRYLWAVGATAMQIRAGEIVKDRYEVVASQIWRDMQPELLPEICDRPSDDIFPYLRLYPHHLHVPDVYGVCKLGESEVILLENVPIDASGELYPSLKSMWTQVSAVRQVYWLWQILDAIRGNRCGIQSLSA
jgi:protein phosphatase